MCLQETLQPPKVVAPPTEEALQQLSEARRMGSSGHPPRSELAHSSSSATAQLSHSSSTLTNSSSNYTASMSSADTVLPRTSGPVTAQSGGLRKRPCRRYCLLCGKYVQASLL